MRKRDGRIEVRLNDVGRAVAREAFGHVVAAERDPALLHFHRHPIARNPAVPGEAIQHGLGDLGIRYGYERFEPAVMLVTVAVLIALVQLVQMLGDRVARRLSHR